MGTFSKKEVVFFEFPYTDLSQRKRRPCLVLSETMGKDILLCQITSKERAEDDYSVSIDAEDMELGIFTMRSFVRTNKLFTADASEISEKIGILGDSAYQRVVRKIITMIS